MKLAQSMLVGETVVNSCRVTAFESLSPRSSRFVFPIPTEASLFGRKRSECKEIYERTSARDVNTRVSFTADDLPSHKNRPRALRQIIRKTISRKHLISRGALIKYSTEAAFFYCLIPLEADIILYFEAYGISQIDLKRLAFQAF